MNAPRFLAILDTSGLGNGTRLATAATESLDLAPAFSGERLRLFTSAGTPVRHIGDHAVLVGRIFPNGRRESTDLDLAAHDAEGRALIENWWGDYVCLIERRESAANCIVRSPSGGMHAYRARGNGVTWIASHIEILLALHAARRSVDWAFTANHLAFTHLPVAATGITGIDEILPGDCVTERDGGSFRTGLWSPWAFASADRRIPTLEEAARHVADAVNSAVAALTAPEDPVLLELSGGLDSSIVAAAIARAGRTARAVNLATPGPEGDERYYARLVAERCSMPLLEARIDADIDLTAAVPGLTARPALPAMLRPVDAYFEAAAHEQGARVFISGTGGDSVFCSLASATPATDLIRAGGSAAAIVRTLRDIASVHDTNIWRVAAIMARQIRRARPALRWKRNTQFLNVDRLPEAPPDHPWLDEPDDALPGTRAHIRAIMAAYAHLDDYGRHKTAPSIYPLLAQPVVEACLAVPSWLWVSGGLNRAVARAAFADFLPDAIIERRTKGAMDAYCARTFETNRERLKPYLLDGCLAGAGLLDRPAIEAYLSTPLAARDARFYHLLPVADTEAWARGVLSSS